MKKNVDDEQAKEILRIAEECGVQGNYFFKTTFERYQFQLKLLEGFKKTIEAEGLVVEKEYVRGRKNLYSSPAVRDYNSTTDCANRTVSTLMKIIRSWNVQETSEDDDPLSKIINGDVDE